MKILTKLAILAIIILGILHIQQGFAAGIVDLDAIQGIDKVKKISIEVGDKASGDIVKNVNNVGFSILKFLKLILQGILIIYVVYTGISMVISMGTDEDKLTKSKNQLWYSLVALLFINIPGTIYTALKAKPKGNIDTGTVSSGEFTEETIDSILFINIVPFRSIIDNVVLFMEVIIFGIALYVIIMAGIKILTSRGKEEQVTESKSKIIYSIIAMIFVGFAEVWRNFAVTGDMASLVGTSDTSIFSKIINLSLLFAGPVAIFFLTLAGYYYITSNGEEEKIKKAKSIIINTMIAVLLLVAMMTFLNDLLTLGE